jgi:4-hydroxy-2-oxoheptanedioate aldolase
MIETKAGLDNLDAILETDGIDGVFIGPADLALALDAQPLADSADDRLVSAVRHIRERAHAHGRRVGIFCKGADFASLKIDEGFDLVSVAPDLTLIMDGARAAVQFVRDHLTAQTIGFGAAADMING